MLVQALMTFCNNGYRVTLSGVAGTATGALLTAEAEAEGLPADFVPDLDTALELAETRLLSGHQEMTDTARYALADMSILSGLAAEDYRALETVVRPYSYADGERIISHDTAVEAVFLVASGLVDLTLPAADGRPRRLASVGPGQCFGEAALADGAAIAADAHAKGAATCYALPVAELRALSADRPGLLPAILSNIVRSLGARLRQAHDEIRRLE
jgi:glutaminase